MQIVIFFTEKQDFNGWFEDFYCTSLNNHRIGFEKKICIQICFSKQNIYLMALLLSIPF